MAPQYMYFKCLLIAKENQNSVPQGLNQIHKYWFCYLDKDLVPKLSFLIVDDQTLWWQIGLSQTRCSSQKTLSEGQISGRKEMALITLGSATWASSSAHTDRAGTVTRNCAASLPQAFLSPTGCVINARNYSKRPFLLPSDIFCWTVAIKINSTKRGVFFPPASCLSTSVNIRLYLKSGLRILQLLTMRQASEGSCTRHRLTGGWGGVWEKGVLKVLKNLLPHC